MTEKLEKPAAAPETTAASGVPMLPEKMLPKLRQEWLQANGAAQAAEAARQVANGLFAQYQQHIGTCIEMMGLDATKRWKANLDTGELVEASPEESIQMNGAMNGAGSMLGGN